MKLCLTIARETAWKLRVAVAKKNLKKSSWYGVLDRVEVSTVMPSQRSPDKETLSFYVPRPLGRRLRKLAQRMKVTLTDIVVMILTKETNHVELTAEDYEQIARDTRAAQRKSATRPEAKAAREGKD